MAALNPERVPGCGLAAFAGLLLCLFGLGMAGILFSSYSMLTSGGALAPQKVSYGGVVDNRMLEPMRDAGLLGPGEIPDVFHAENVPGTAACAISSGKVLRLSEQGPQTIPLAAITSVSGTDTSVTVSSAETTITCPFEPDEGADRFLRMLQNR